jgi:ribosomal protein S18 acetylase RimI-like enzyme
LTLISVRAVERADATDIRSLALDNQMFGPEDMGPFDEMLAGFFSGELSDHHWVAAVDEGRVVAAAYYAPEPFSDRMWNLYFIATAPDAHGTGVGSTLLRAVESDLRARGEQVARVLIVDTSSTDGYQQARTFYLRSGFDEEARVRDFYGPGDHKVTFWKSLVD